MERLVYTKEEVAKMLGISSAQLMRLDIPHFKMVNNRYGRVYFKASDLIGWLTKQGKPNTPQIKSNSIVINNAVVKA